MVRFILLSLIVFVCERPTSLSGQDSFSAVNYPEVTSVATNADRPNIIVILVDDMGFSDLGCYGSEIETPNIDALADGGLRFTQFYNQGRCCPTRASLITGLQPHQVGIGHMTEPPGQTLGITGPYQGYLNNQCTTIASVLKDSGYNTLMTGKWHLGFAREECWPLQRGFDKYYGCISGAINYFKPGDNRFIYDGNQQVETDEDFYATDTFTDKACQYISEATKTSDAPFFLYLAYNAPHWPMNAKWEDYKKYRGKYKSGWHELMRYRNLKQEQLGLLPKGTKPAPFEGPDWDSLDDQQQDRLDAVMAAYAGCVDSIDQSIGKLVKHLKSEGQYRNTVILFLSDNGACQEGGDFGVGDEAMVKDPPLETVDGVRIGKHWANACSTPFRKYKHFVHEGGACTPMIAHWPAGIRRKDRGSFVRQPAYLQDFMTTAIELSGGSYPAGIPACEGQSIVPLLKGSREPIHTKPLFFEHEGNAAMRDGDWKLVREYKKPWELFHVADDRTELNDLSTKETQRLNEMITQWETWATKTDVAYPERFNMYQFLNQKRKKQNQQRKNQNNKQPIPGSKKKKKDDVAATGITSPVSLISTKPPHRQPKQRPNIVVFLSDDHTITDSSLYGSTDLPTPNMERIAATGMTLDRAYVASPSCAPSRAAMLTGLFPANNGAEPNHSKPDANIKKLPAYLQQLGYEVVSFGKVGHYRQTPDYGFDLARHFNYHEDVAVDESIKWLKQRDSEKPLCLFVGTNWPHVPWPEDSKFDPKQVTIPSHHVDTPESRRARAAYYEAVATMDRELGKVYDAAKQKLGDEFFFLHTSDHGAQWPFAKWNLYEEGVRTPMIATWPGRIQPGVRSNAMVSWIDILPTLVDVAGGPKVENIDGKSMLDLFQGKTDRHREEILTTHSGDNNKNVFPARAIRVGKYKYIRNLYPEFRFESHVTKVSESNSYWPSWEAKAKTDPHAQNVVDAYRFRDAEELFDLSSDPGEQNNLINDPVHTEALNDLRSRLDVWLKSTEDTLACYHMPDLRPRAGKSAQPNVVTIFIDDMGWADLSCFGGETPTPNIDRLATEGIKFHHFYVNSPICSSSRCALTTGQYPQRLKITSFLARRELNKKRGMADWLDPTVETLPRMMQRAGYATGHFGKWHLGGQRDVGDAPLITEYGFDRSLTNFEGLGPRVLPLKDKYDGSKPKPHALGSDQLGRGKIEWLDRSQITARFVHDAVQFIDESQKEGKPFFVNIWPDDVHSPFFPPQGMRGDQQKKTLYQAVLKTMDRQLNELFERIENDPKLRNNTVILIASDNGPEPGAGTAGHLKGVKGELWEGGIRSPLIVWSPGFVTPKATGSTNNQTILASIDLVSSLVTLCDLKPGSDFKPDGEDLLGALLGYSDAQRSAPICWRRPPGHKKFRPGFNPDLAIRDKRFKLVCRMDGSNAKLFDLIDDPGETNNLIQQKKAIGKRLLKAVLEWNSQIPVDASATDYDQWSVKAPASKQKKGSKQAKAGASAKPVEKVSGDRDNEATSTPPNVVVILADDLGWNAVGYHNDSFKTPNIDSIATNGLTLNRFYVAPMCSPTRAGFMTGRYPIRFGCARAVIPPQRDFGLPNDETTIGEVFQQLGYQSRGVFGKWHLGHRRAKWHPLNQGFTHFVGHYNGAIDYFELSRNDQRDWHEGYETSDDEGYATDLIADAACEFIRKASSKNSPYFCYVPFNAPHSPFQAPEEALANVDPSDSLKPQEAKRWKTYAAMVQRMDRGIGKILQSIEDSGKSENTIVVFFSDNGGVGSIAKNNHPLRGQKLTVYEGGIRVPACIRWPRKIKPSSQFDGLVGYIDLLPTLVAATENEISSAKQPLDGVNFLPALLGQPDAIDQLKQRDWYSYHGQQNESKEHLAVTSGGWKLKINGPRFVSLEQLKSEQNQVELFHLDKDLLEQNNVRSQFPDRVRQLANKLIAHRKLQPTNGVPVYSAGRNGFVAPKDWKLDPSDPQALIGRYSK
ncbi:MAG: sulfatase-like hydrolase/transferase [Planctomycetota bacterium]